MLRVKGDYSNIAVWASTCQAKNEVTDDTIARIRRSKALASRGVRTVMGPALR